MNDPRRPGSGRDPGPDVPWYLRRPAPDDQTGIARARPAPPPAYPPPTHRRPPTGDRTPPPPDIPWYLQRPERPPPDREKPSVATKDATAPRHARLLRWLLVTAGGLAVVLTAAVLLISRLGVAGGAVLDVTKVQAGVLQTLSDPASGYGANSVTDVSCNDGRNPSARKGTTFTCDATVNGTQRHVTVVVSDDHGTYEIDGPR